MPKKALSGCTISLFGRSPAWDNDKQKKVPQWLANLSGKFTQSFSDSTTHLVVSRKRWREEPRPAPLQKALDEKAKGRDLKIVTFDWLEDCLTLQSRKREAPYEWEKRDAEDAKLTAKAAKATQKGTAKSVPGIMSEMFHESTEQYVDPEDRAKMERQLEKEREISKAKELEAKEDRIRRQKEQAKIFARGAKKARNEALSGESVQFRLTHRAACANEVADTYHIYQDSTGFKYDVLVTKIDMRCNRNERVALSVSTSLIEPRQFADARL